MLTRFFSIIILLLFVSVPCFSETVIYNTQTGKYHKVTCRAAIKCTKNCIKIDKTQAKQRGGTACKMCGG